MSFFTSLSLACLGETKPALRSFQSQKNRFISSCPNVPYVAMRLSSSVTLAVSEPETSCCSEGSSAIYRSKDSQCGRQIDSDRHRVRYQVSELFLSGGSCVSILDMRLG